MRAATQRQSIRDTRMFLRCKQYSVYMNVNTKDFNDMRNRLAQFYVSNGNNGVNVTM